jgi:hypothetical protein
MFNSNVQPKRMKANPAAWHCNCRQPLGPYNLNHAQLARCPACDVARHSDPTARANAKLAPHPSTSLSADRGAHTSPWSS